MSIHICRSMYMTGNKKKHKTNKRPPRNYSGKVCRNSGKKSNKQTSLLNHMSNKKGYLLIETMGDTVLLLRQ